MATGIRLKATIDDLYREKGKAELIGGRIVRLMPTGRKPNRTAARIFKSLDNHAEATGRGEAYTDNMGFTVPVLTSGRESFSPDASFYSGPLHPITRGRGQIADAEPAVPGWCIPVDRIFG